MNYCKLIRYVLNFTFFSFYSPHFWSHLTKISLIVLSYFMQDVPKLSLYLLKISKQNKSFFNKISYYILKELWVMHDEFFYNLNTFLKTSCKFLLQLRNEDKTTKSPKVYIIVWIENFSSCLANSIVLWQLILQLGHLFLKISKPPLQLLINFKNLKSPNFYLKIQWVVNSF